MSETRTLDLPSVRASPVRWRPGLTRRGRAAGAVYLLLDTSASMGDADKLPQLRRGALRFFAEAYGRGYKVGAVQFGDRARRVAKLSRDFAYFQRCLRPLQAEGRTAMSAALNLAVRQLRRQQRPVIVLITDGQPNDPLASRRAALRARAQGIRLLPVGVQGADKAFLASLLPQGELPGWAEPGALAGELRKTAKQLEPGSLA